MPATPQTATTTLAVRRTKHFTIHRHVIPASHGRTYRRSTSSESDVLRIVVNQYVPTSVLTGAGTSRPGDVTIIGGHANAFAKECYEPLWDDLYERSQEGIGFGIRAIWIADVAWQGESGVLNEDMLGVDVAWYDHSRDLLQLVNIFRDEFQPPLFGIGHSMGGTQLAALSQLHPRLFVGLALVEPVMYFGEKFGGGDFTPTWNLIQYLSSIRRDVWPDRATAEKALRKSPMLFGWDERVVQQYLANTFRSLPTPVYTRAPETKDYPDPTSAVTLTTSKHQEVFSFIRGKYPSVFDPAALATYTPPFDQYPDIPPKFAQHAFYRAELFDAHRLLATMRPRLFLIDGGRDDPSNTPLHAEKLRIAGSETGGNGGVSKGGVKGLLLEEHGHLIPMENPKRVAEEVGTWITSELQRWKAIDAEERAEWEATQALDGGRGRFTMPPNHVKWLKVWSGIEDRPKKGPKL